MNDQVSEVPLWFFVSQSQPLEEWCTDSQQILHGHDRLSSHAFVQENLSFVRRGFIQLSAAHSNGTCKPLSLFQLTQYLVGKQRSAAPATNLSVPFEGQRSSGVLEYFQFRGIKFATLFIKERNSHNRRTSCKRWVTEGALMQKRDTREMERQAYHKEI